MKTTILEKLDSIPGLTVRIIQNLTYSEYKTLISKAKWSLTFGEGLDGYLIEPVFSGAIGFAVYNQQFFTEDFSGLPSVYPDIETLSEKITNDISLLDHAEEFRSCQRQLFDICAFHYSAETYKKNIVSFYKGDFTYA
jgi:hypothetical protein